VSEVTVFNVPQDLFLCKAVIFSEVKYVVYGSSATWLCK